MRERKKEREFEYQTASCAIISHSSPTSARCTPQLSGFRDGRFRNGGCFRQTRNHFVIARQRGTLGVIWGSSLRIKRRLKKKKWLRQRRRKTRTKKKKNTSKRKEASTALNGSEHAQLVRKKTLSHQKKQNFLRSQALQACLFLFLSQAICIIHTKLVQLSSFAKLPFLNSGLFFSLLIIFT